MAKLRSIGKIVARQMGGAGVRRTLATVLAVALTLTSTAPAWALKVEVEAEGEGSASPGTLPGLEAGPELEGEETELSEEAPQPGEEVEEEAVIPVGPGSPEPEPPAPPPVEEPKPEVAVTPEAASPPTPVPPPSPAPEYEAEAPATYEPEAQAPAVVRGEAIVAHPAQPRRGHDGGSHPRAQGAPETEPVVEAPAPPAGPEPGPRPAPAGPVEPPPAAPAVRPDSLAGSGRHVVRAGECLWTIAEGALPAGASEPRIAAEVHRLWRLNADRIGTGDPSLIYAGTRLRLR